ncbi:hypothetical protein KSS87_010869 [Heliosperma pusillum]|nr:hypothetical protein KSS87_010869 [Heliosperma pusillum]
MALMRSLYRSPSIKSSLYSTVLGNRFLHDTFSQQPSSRSFFSLSSSSPLIPTFPDCRSPFGTSVGSIRSFSIDVAHYPEIKDPEINNIFKDFMAAGWGELPDSLIKGALKVLAKDTDDTAGKESLKNVFRAAEAVEEFIGTLESLRMAIDDHGGLSGENEKPYPEYYGQALKTAYDRYTKYLDSFGPDEFYLKKKVETEVGTRMIHLKMRCSHLGSEWGKVTVLGTSGISGSYVEQRAR